jgi:hypothetical protein
MSWLAAQGWVRTLFVWGALVLTAFLFLLGLRRQGEKTGELRAELQHARNIERVRARMEEIPRPHRGDVVERLRNHDF